MADPYYGEGGSGYYTDPATGRRYWQDRNGAQGADAFDPQYQSTLIYDPQTQATDGSGSPNNGLVFPAGELATNHTGVPLSDAQKSAKGILNAALSQYGLGSLSEKAWGMYLSGESMDQIMLELRATPEYKQRFPGMDALASKGRAISEGEYISIEKQYVSLFRQAGLPAGFYDQPDDFGNFIANEVSPQEMGARLDVARTALYETPPQVRDELQRLYNVDAGGVMAFLLDPTKALPIIQQQFTAAEAGYAAKASGYGLLTRSEAESLGYDQRSFDQLTQGFGQLANEKELFNPILGETNSDVVTRDEQLSAEFGGNTSAQRRLQRRAQERVAGFQGGGGFASTQGGVTGLSSANA